MDAVEGLYHPVCAACTVLCSELGVVGCHAGRGPSTQTCQVDFISTVAEPGVDEAVAQHVRVKRNRSLAAPESDDPSDAACGQRTLAADPDPVGV